jgi:hypothetical protein
VTFDKVDPRDVVIALCVLSGVAVVNSALLWGLLSWLQLGSSSGRAFFAGVVGSLATNTLITLIQQRFFTVQSRE